VVADALDADQDELGAVEDGWWGGLVKALRHVGHSHYIMRCTIIDS